MEGKSFVGQRQLPISNLHLRFRELVVKRIFETGFGPVFVFLFP